MLIITKEKGITTPHDIYVMEEQGDRGVGDGGDGYHGQCTRA